MSTEHMHNNCVVQQIIAAAVVVCVCPALALYVLLTRKHLTAVLCNCKYSCEGFALHTCLHP